MYIPKFNYPIPELVLRDPLLAKKDLEKCHAAVDAQFAKLEQCLDSNASDGDRHRASAVLDRLISGDGVNAVFQPPALASRKDALPTELQGSLSLRLPPSGHGEPVVGRQPSAGVRLHSSSRAFGAADADDASLRGAEEAVDDGVPGCDCDDGACTCAADASKTKGEGGGGGAAGARPRSRRPRRRTIDPSGAKSLTKKEVDADRAEYLSGELGRLMLRRHLGILRRHHASPIDPTLNTNLNNYRPSACEQ